MNSQDSGTSQKSPVEVAVAIIIYPQTNNSIQGLRPNGLSGGDLGPRGAPPDPCPRILITQRPSATVYGGYWEFPGGKVEPGETPQACAAREALEEVGLAVEPVAVLDAPVHSYEHATVRLSPVVCRLDPESGPPRNLEVADHRWCLIDALPWEAFLPANVRILTRLRRYLDSDAGSWASSPDRSAS